MYYKHPRFPLPLECVIAGNLFRVSIHFPLRYEQRAFIITIIVFLEKMMKAVLFVGLQFSLKAIMAAGEDSG
jgi:hypothetical protein